MSSTFDDLRSKRLASDQAQMIEEVVSTISNEPWFTQERDRRSDFAAQVLQMFLRGLVVRDKLHALCLVMARRRYSEASGPNEAAPTKPR
jgi:hypothetical protein